MKTSLHQSFIKAKYIVQNIRVIRFITNKIKPQNNNEIDAVNFNSIDNINKINNSRAHALKLIALSKDFNQNLFTLLKSKADEINNKTIVDYGCGPGILLHLLGEEFKGNKLIGLDYSDNKINNSKSIFPEIDFMVHDIYTDYSVKSDISICTEVLEHLTNPGLALQKLCNSINENGLVFITVPNGRIDYYHGHIHFWSPESWKLFLEEKIDTDTYDFEVGMFNKNQNNYAFIKRK